MLLRFSSVAELFGVCLSSCAGERTWGVLTKLDLMDKGTNAVDVIFA